MEFNNSLANFTILEYSPTFEFISLGICIPLISIFGIFGNVLSAIVLSRPKMSSPITVLLLALSISDLILVVSSVLLFGIPVLLTFYNTWLRSTWYVTWFYPAFGPYLYAIAITGQTMSIYFTVAVTLERFIIVCFPLKCLSLSTTPRAHKLSVVIILFSILYNLPRWWELYAENGGSGDEGADDAKENSTDSESIISSLEFTEMRLNPTYIEIYVNWAYLFVMFVIPFTILVVFNFAIFYRIQSSNHNRKSLTLQRTLRKEYSYLKILLCVVIIFLLCNTLGFVLNILENFWLISTYDLENLSNMLIVLNSSVNFIIYCTFGKKFRNELNVFISEIVNIVKCLLCCKLPVMRSRSTSVTTDCIKA